MKSILITILIVFFSNATFAETSKELLAKSIALSNSINDSLTVEQKLKKYEEIQALVDQILSAYSGTEEGLKILSGQSVGNFDYSSIQQNYVKELIGYFDVVCGVSPSFECLAFVSLDQGVKACVKAESFEMLDIAHRDIMNALNVFNGQESKKEYKMLALNSYRNCLSVSKVKKTKRIEDYFGSRLVPAFLQLGKTNQAKAIIQQMDDPYLKFAAVLELTNADNKVNLAFVNRMKVFIKEKFGTHEYKRTSVLSYLSLMTLMLDQENYKIDVGNIVNFKAYEGNPNSMGNMYSGMFAGEKPGDDLIHMSFNRYGKNWKPCSASYNKTYFNAIIKYIDSLTLRYNKMKEEGSDFQSVEHSIFLPLSLKAILAEMHVEGYLMKCSIDNRNYGTAVYIYKNLKVFDEAEANKFLTIAASLNYQKFEMTDYLFEYVKNNPSLESDILSGDEEWYRSNLLDPLYDFKVKVLNGKMCKAVDLIFKEYKGTKNYARAIAYLIESSDIDRSKKYDCGDAELEMLLN